MSGLLFCTSDDFHIKKMEPGNLLCHDITGFSLILFYSTQCGHCQKIIPHFKQLPGSVNGCQFGMLNVSKNKKIIGLSQSSIAPISYVPYIIFYANGIPYMRYDGANDIASIRNFVLEMASKLQNKTNFTKKVEGSSQQTPEEIIIPEYTIGIPIQGKVGVTYLYFDDAYPKN